jgi:GAF domain-containing protein
VVLARLHRDGTAPVVASPGTGEERQERMCAAWRDASGPIAACSAVVGDGDDQVAGAPIVVGGAPWGVLLAPVPHNREGNPVAPLEQFTELLAIAVDNARQRRRLAAWAGTSL